MKSQSIPALPPEVDGELPEAAVAYASAGFAIFPLRPRGKTPLIAARTGGHGHKDATNDLERIQEIWRRHPKANIGCVPGMCGLLAVDIDGPEGEDEWKRLGLAATETLIATTGRGRHLYFRHPGGRIGNRKLAKKIDVRADEGYVVLPPSVHPSGAEYHWVNRSIPPQEVPSPLRALLLTEIGEGNRNNALTSYLGSLRRNGADEDELLAAAEKFNNEHCQPPLEPREVRSVVRSILRYSADPTYRAAVEDLNRRYAVVKVGNKVRVLQTDGEEISLLRRDDFATLLSNRRINESGRSIGIANLWLNSEYRRTYEGIVFEPGVQDVGANWNLWRGWAVEPKEGDCSLFLQHVRENTCQGNEELYRWVIAWFADLFQNPREKPGTALVFGGKQGTGKTIVGTVIGKLLGKHYQLVASPHRVTGAFNAHMERCLLLQADEAFWAGDKQAEGTLKNLITSSHHHIERKGVEAVEVPNYVRLLVTSNSKWKVPAGLKERRFCVIEVGENRMQDKVFFGALDRQMRGGGYEALLHHLQTLDCSAIDLRTIPETAALFEEKVATLDPEEAWWLDILIKGYIPGDGTGEGEAPKHWIFEDYIRHAQNAGRRRRSSETTVGMFLKEYVPNISTDYLFRHGKKIPTYIFPSLAECRQTISRLAGYSGTWGAPAEWEADPHMDAESEEDTGDSF
jgi:hypothetical protein